LSRSKEAAFSHAPARGMIGILLVNKPKGLTSHDVVARVRRAFKTKRVGHAGTLDPLAEGLLVLAIGPATRFLNYLPLEPKEYRAVVKFGEETTTYDAEGDVVCAKPVPDDLDARLESLIPSFSGEISQMPPIYSAIKKDGRPLYDYARKGEEVEREARQVVIHSIKVSQGLESGERVLYVDCGGGTYIRSLAHDLGQAVGCGGTIVGLTRTRTGSFSVENSVGLEELLLDRLIPLKDALAPMPMIVVDPSDEEHIRQGRRIGRPLGQEQEVLALCGQNNEVFALARVVGSELQPECVIPRAPDA
jgi:tRNA pseudouridine55 synthase